MPRKRTGNILREGDHFVARILLDDGKYARIHLPPEMSEAKAKDRAEFYAQNPDKAREKLESQKAQKSNIAPIPKGETFAEYLERWLVDRDKRGNGSTYNDRQSLQKHVCPHIGTKPITHITREDIEKIVQIFDECISSGKNAWRTVRRWWSTLRKLFSDACKSKNLALRVRKDNPTNDVAPPDRGDDKAKAFLFPSEFVKVVSCSKVELQFRRILTLAIYLYCRTSEVMRLRWEDINLEHGIITICRSWDRNKKTEKSTKGKRARTFRIEPNLLPLLRIMYAERDNSGRVFHGVGGHFAKLFRKALHRAGITRADLFASDEQHTAIRFHDCRATGITWMAIRGDTAQVIMQRVGHQDFGTTQIYIRQAEALGPTVGQPFPPLPTCLLETNPSGDDGGSKLSGKTLELSSARSELPTNEALSSHGRHHSKY